MENKYNQTQSAHPYLIVGLIIALIIGFFAVFQAIRLQNRASETIDSGGSCRESLATCTQDLTNIDPNLLPNITLEVTGGGSTQKGGVIIGNEMKFSFVSKVGVTYACKLIKIDGTEFDEKCPLPIGSGAPLCGAPTPTISAPTPTTSPTPVKCEDCIDGEFVCREGATTQEQKDLYSITAGAGSSCPALRLDLINYKDAGAGTCPQITPAPTTLDCDKHLVYIESVPGFNRLLTKDECLEVKKQSPEGFLMRLHTGLAGSGCRNYEIKAYEKLVTKDQNGNEIVDAGNPLRICDKCDLQVGCPSGCWADLPQSGGTTKLDETKLIDIPGIQKNDRECPANDFCNLTISGGACNSAGTETTFGIQAKGSARLYLDDQFGGKEWVDVTGKTVYNHNFKYSGYYDVVLECKNEGNTSPQNFYCAQRVTKMCGGGSTPTPPPACPALTVVLDLKCPGGQCPTVTPVQTP